MKPGCKVCQKARTFLPSPMRQRLEKIERDRAARLAARIKRHVKALNREEPGHPGSVPTNASQSDGMPPTGGQHA